MSIANRPFSRHAPQLKTLEIDKNGSKLFQIIVYIGNKYILCFNKMYSSPTPPVYVNTQVIKYVL